MNVIDDKESFEQNIKNTKEKIMKCLVVDVFLLITLVFSNTIFAASFDCGKASRTQDKMICVNTDLSQADTQLAELYKQALQNASDKDTLKQSQINWLKMRDACQDTKCMLQAYQSRINALQKAQDNTAMASATNTSAQQNIAGKYPVWISPELGVKSLSEQDINAALARKFWDNPVYQQTFKKQLEYLKTNYQKQGLPTSCLDVIQLIKEGKYDFEGTVGTYFSDKDVINLYNTNYTPLIHRAETDCQAVRLLKQVKPAVESAVHDFEFSNKLADVMPALAAPDDSACVPNMDEEGDRLPLWFPRNQKKSWSQFYHYNRSLSVYPATARLKFLNVTPNSVTLEFSAPKDAPYGNTTIQLLAKGDFTGTGKEELLIAMQFHQNYISPQADENIFSALFLMTRKNITDALEVLYPHNYMFFDNRTPICDEKLFSLTDRRT